jgi:predicted short-subunit dehydrogenase-like oxidoreductase (DUF2520 family)
MISPRIVVVGAGNVAWHLARRAHAQGLSVEQVFSRDPVKASNLATAIAAQPISVFDDLDVQADYYVLAVSDAAIGSVAAKMGERLPPSACVVHTSGATPLSVLQPHFERCGVLYPLQTFSKNREVDFSKVPICLETAQKEDYPGLEHLARRLSDQVYAVDSEKRQTLHLAAVFVNNFVNHLYSIGAALLNENDLPFALLQPLIQETAAKIQDHAPATMQTGPAVRGDQVTMERHRALLNTHPDLQQLYQFFSTAIQKHHH